MKDHHSFEDIIRDKTESANHIPSDKVWNELSQIELPHHSQSKKSFRMKAILFSITSIILFSAIFYNYQDKTSHLDVQENQEGHGYSSDELDNHLLLNPLEKAKEKAQKEGKFILVKILMEGCTFCGKMERETFLTEEVQNTVNNQFITVALDIKDPNHQSFFKQHNVNAAPISLFMDKEGTVLAKVSGFKEKSVYLNVIQGVINGERENIPLEQTQTIQTKKEIKEEQPLDNPVTIKVYPNPNNGQFKLDIQGDEGDALIHFLDLDGRLLLKEKTKNIVEGITMDYDFSNREQGMIIKVKQGKNSATEKIMIIK